MFPRSPLLPIPGSALMSECEMPAALSAERGRATRKGETPCSARMHMCVVRGMLHVGVLHIGARGALPFLWRYS